MIADATNLKLRTTTSIVGGLGLAVTLPGYRDKDLSRHGRRRQALVRSPKGHGRRQPFCPHLSASKGNDYLGGRELGSSRQRPRPLPLIRAFLSFPSSFSFLSSLMFLSLGLRTTYVANECSIAVHCLGHHILRKKHPQGS
jgi:hypothetical protein